MLLLLIIVVAAGRKVILFRGNEVIFISEMILVHEMIFLREMMILVDEVLLMMRILVVAGAEMRRLNFVVDVGKGMTTGLVVKVGMSVGVMILVRGGTGRRRAGGKMLIFRMGREMLFFGGG